MVPGRDPDNDTESRATSKRRRTTNPLKISADVHDDQLSSAFALEDQLSCANVNVDAAIKSTTLCAKVDPVQFIGEVKCLHVDTVNAFMAVMKDYKEQRYGGGSKDVGNISYHTMLVERCIIPNSQD